MTVLAARVTWLTCGQGEGSSGSDRVGSLTSVKFRKRSRCVSVQSLEPGEGPLVLLALSWVHFGRSRWSCPADLSRGLLNTGRLPQSVEQQPLCVSVND